MEYTGRMKREREENKGRERLERANERGVIKVDELKNGSTKAKEKGERERGRQMEKSERREEKGEREMREVRERERERVGERWKRESTGMQIYIFFWISCFHN